MNLATLALFILWLVYGGLYWRSLSRWRIEPPALPAPKRPIVAALWLFGSATLLLGGLFLIFQAGGFPRGGITAWAWALSLVLGFGFVHGQVTAAALLFSMGSVTNALDNASEPHGEVTSPHENSTVDGDGVGVELDNPRKHPTDHG